jgi:hypothetical protein
MDIRELDKKQLVLLTLLITFVVSIATGIVTVSLMNQMPKSVPQTINNVIQRTIEKVTTVQVPVPVVDEADNNVKQETNPFLGSGDALVSIYLNNNTSTETGTTAPTITNSDGSVNAPLPIGQGVIISDVGLVLVDSSLLNDQDSYKVVLDKRDFNVSILKKFGNGFTILKISAITDKPLDTTGSPDEATKTQ